MLIGVKTDKKLKVDFVDVEFGTDPDEKATDRRELAIIHAYYVFFGLVFTSLFSSKRTHQPQQ